MSEPMTALEYIEQYIDLEPREVQQLVILWNGGADGECVMFAVEAWRRAGRVNDDWAYMRTAILCRAAEKAELRQMVQTESGDKR